MHIYFTSKEQSGLTNKLYEKNTNEMPFWRGTFKVFLFFWQKETLHIFANFVLSVSLVKPTPFLLLSKLDHTITSFTFSTLLTGPKVRADLSKKTYPYWVSPCLGLLLISTTWALLSFWSTSYKSLLFAWFSAKVFQIMNSKMLVRDRKEENL